MSSYRALGVKASAGLASTPRRGRVRYLLSLATDISPVGPTFSVLWIPGLLSVFPHENIVPHWK